ncbi:MAG TPA: glycosyltransferase [Gemmatimonadaceae bacterium]|nr:glycosyltransferase [Gemmatimonadaceae bacterium]
MRVLFLTHSFPRYPGDVAGSFVLRLATALGNEGVAVRVVAPSASDTSSRDEMGVVGVERFRYAPRRLETLAYTGNMAAQVRQSWGARIALAGLLGAELVATLRAVRAFRPDVLHAHWWFPNGVVGGWAGAITHVPMVTTFHGTDVRMARAYPVSRPLFRRVLRRSAAVTAVSRWLAAEAQEMSGIMPKVAPMPVETGIFTPPAPGVRTDRLLFVGRLTRQKGVDLLLRALAILPDAVALDVVGDGDERAALEALSTELGVARRVTWHGAQPGDALPAFYRRARALVVSSVDEGLGLVAVEAQLCETPVVALASGGLIDVVEHGVTGLLVEQRDPAALAGAIATLAALPDGGASFGKAGRERALSHFAPSVAARRYLDIYRSALGRTSI